MRQGRRHRAGLRQLRTSCRTHEAGITKTDNPPTLRQNTIRRTSDDPPPRCHRSTANGPFSTLEVPFEWQPGRHKHLSDTRRPVALRPSVSSGLPRDTQILFNTRDCSGVVLSCREINRLWAHKIYPDARPFHFRANAPLCGARAHTQCCQVRRTIPCCRINSCYFLLAFFG